MSYPKDEYPGDRPYECDGSHQATFVREIDGVEIYICADPCCAKLIKAICTHVQNSWNPEGTVLSCDFCGADGT